MMDERRAVNRSMFWRVIRRMVFANRGRLFVILLALGAGSAVTAALLNLQIDAKRRVNTEFRTFGANVLVTPGQGNSNEQSDGLLNESVIPLISDAISSTSVQGSGVLYGLASVRRRAAGALK